ncbi:MAG: hypothetical protein JRN20_16225 [Nitrososphaerota archaeon]|nr:hypothetical protein [Nitrososphaerota archaeon]
MKKNPSSKKKRAVSTALGTMLFVIVALSAISSFSALLSNEAKATQAAALVENTLNERSKEVLFAYYSGSNSRIEVINNGSVSSEIAFVTFVDSSTGQMSLCPSSSAACTISPSLPAVISPSASGYFTLSNAPTDVKVGLVTSLGHAIWVSSGMPPNKIQSYTLTMVANPSSGGTTGPAAGAYFYPSGAQVTISACPAQGYSFLGWSGDGNGSYSGSGQSGNCVGSGSQPRNSAAITMDGNVTEIANFG